MKASSNGSKAGNQVRLPGQASLLTSFPQMLAVPQFVSQDRLVAECFKKHVSGGRTATMSLAHMSRREAVFRLPALCQARLLWTGTVVERKWIIQVCLPDRKQEWYVVSLQELYEMGKTDECDTVGVDDPFVHWRKEGSFITIRPPLITTPHQIPVHAGRVQSYCSPTLDRCGQLHLTTCHDMAERNTAGL